MLDLNVRRLGHISIIEAGGRIDGISAGTLAALLTDEITLRGSRIILDLAKVDYLSGAGLKVLKELSDKTGEVLLSRPSDRVREVMEIIGLDATFKTYEDRLHAVRAISPITNAHTHLELGWLANYRPGITGAPFAGWIIGLVERRRRLGNDWERVMKLSIDSAIQTLLESGTTTIGDISSTGLSIEPLLNSGLSGVVYVEVLSPWSREADERLAKARGIIDQWRGKERNGLHIGLSIHTAYTTHPDLWRKALDYARAENLPLCIHAAESPEESDYMLRGTGAIADYEAKLEADYSSPMRSTIRYLDDLGALELKPLLVHAVQVDDDDIRRIKAGGARVVHCPRSNIRLRCGRMPLEKYLAHNIPVYIGTDSLGSSPSLDIFEEVEFAVALHYEKIAPEIIEKLVYQDMPA